VVTKVCKTKGDEGKVKTCVWGCPRGLQDRKKNMRGRFFFAKSSLAGLTNYVIRHEPKYGNMTSLSQAFCQHSSHPSQSHFVGTCLRATHWMWYCVMCVSHQLHHLAMGSVSMSKAHCRLVNSPIWKFFENLSIIYVKFSCFSVLSLTSACYSAKSHSEVEFLPKLGVAQNLFCGLMLD